jgi:hypothetical protein
MALIVQTLGVVGTLYAATIAVKSYVNSNKRAEEGRKRELETRQAQLFLQLYNQYFSKDFIAAISNVGKMNYQAYEADFQDFLSKYDSSVNPDHFAKRTSIFSIYETLGYLLKHGLVDKELVYINGGMSSIFIWAKYKSVMEAYRKVAVGSDASSYFEYFAVEMWKIKSMNDPLLVRDQTIGLDFEKTFGTK